MSICLSSPSISNRDYFLIAASPKIFVLQLIVLKQNTTDEYSGFSMNKYQKNDLFYLARLTLSQIHKRLKISRQGLFQKIWACVRYNQKRAKKSSKRAQVWVFTPYFCKFRTFRTLHLPKRHVFLEVLVEKKAFCFSKRALCAGTARNKWLK